MGAWLKVESLGQFLVAAWQAWLGEASKCCRQGSAHWASSCWV